MANSTADSSFSTYGFENELSGYKAVSGGAIFSAIMGFASLLMFVDMNFFFIPLLAILFGFLALRRIKRFPDVYTGLKLAQAGIGLAVIFTLVSFSIGFAFQYTLNSEARAYANSLVEVLGTRKAEEIFFLKIPESQRTDLTPEKLIAQKLESGPEGKMGLDTDLKPLKQLVLDRDAPGAKVSFDQIEMADYDKLTPYAFLRYSVSGGAVAHEHKKGDGHDHKDGDGHDHKDDGHGHVDANGDEQLPGGPSATATDSEPQYLMIQIKAEKHEGRNSWYISEILYPYKKDSAKPKAEKVDDGHGHAH